MKKLLLFILTISALQARSQTSIYHPFPEDTATWVTDTYYNTCFGYCNTMYYQMKGDTVLNGQTYNKIYTRTGEFFYITAPPNVTLGTDFTSCQYVGGIRQDIASKKVYFIDSTMTNDTLLFDFDLAVGDTIDSWYNKNYMVWPLVVDIMDSILINGSYHKRFSFQNTLPTRGLIEGVGWEGELFGISPSVYTLTLACFNGNPILNQAFVGECSVNLDCSISLGVNEHGSRNNIAVFPNPVTDRLSVNVNNNEELEISVYDVTSRKITNEHFTNAMDLNTTHLNKGIYFYDIADQHGWSYQGKFVKQ